MERIKDFIRGPRFRELLIYGVVGGLTTLINYGAYAGITRGWAAIRGLAPDQTLLVQAANVLAWILAVAFAFWANKKFVFRSPDWGRRTIARELPSFVGARLISLGFDALFLLVAVHALGMNDLIAKLASNVIVIVLNYFASKFWIFRRRSDK